MKKLLSLILLGSILFSFAGCKKDDSPGTTGTTQASTSAPTETTAPETQITTVPTDASVPLDTQPVISRKIMYAISLPITRQSQQAEDGTTIFTQEYPHMELVHPDPEVADKIIVDFQNRIDQSNKDAANVASDAQYDYAGGEFNSYFHTATYTPKRIDSSVLSLDGLIAYWSGAIHSDRVSVCANYDMVTGDVLTLAGILYRDEYSDELCQLLLDALASSEYAEYLYSSYTETVSARFGNAMSYDENWYFDDQGLTFCFSPYDIAPYSCGIVKITIPYSQLGGIIADAYFPDERDTTSGQVLATGLTDAMSQASAFTQIAEIIADRDADSFFLYTDKSVTDVQIEQCAWSDVLGDYMLGSVIFATGTLTPGDAVRVEAALPEVGEQADFILKLSYTTGGETVSKYIYKDPSTNSIVFTD